MKIYKEYREKNNLKDGEIIFNIASDRYEVLRDEVRKLEGFHENKDNDSLAFDVKIVLKRSSADRDSLLDF
jgi:hypothetical protein